MEKYYNNFNKLLSNYDLIHSNDEEKISSLFSFDDYKTSYRTSISNSDKADIIRGCSDRLSIVDGIPFIDGSSLAYKNYKDYRVDELSSNNIVYVHCTDFFPENHKILCNFDGQKKLISPKFNLPNGEQAITIEHRHTVHFTANGIVGDTSDGNSWDTDIIVIDSLKNHIGDNLYGGYSDYYLDKSVDLSDDTVILIRKSRYESLTEEQKKEYNFVLFEGNFRNALINYLLMNNYPIAKLNQMDAGHSNSEFRHYEIICNARDYALNYIKNIINDGMNTIYLSIEELVKLIDLVIDNWHYGSLDENEEKIKYFLKYAGIKKCDDGRFVVIPEYDNFSEFQQNINQDENILCIISDYNNYKQEELAKKAREEAERAEQAEKDQIDAILNTPFEQLDFSNAFVRKVVIKYINSVLKCYDIGLSYNSEFSNFKIDTLNDNQIEIFKSMPNYDGGRGLIFALDMKENAHGNKEIIDEKYSEIYNQISNYIVYPYLDNNQENDQIKHM